MKKSLIVLLSALCVSGLNAQDYKSLFKFSCLK